MIFWMLLFWVGAFLLTEILRPKPNMEDARPAGQGDFQFPTATEGRAVPLIWGKVKIKGSNVIWYGNVRSVAITEDVKTGLFSSDTVTTGHKYYVGLQFALCLGPGVVLKAIRVNEKSLWSGTRAAESTFNVSRLSILGGNEFGSGGISGTVGFYPGAIDQSINAYLAGKQSPNVAYRGTSYVVFQGGYIGNSPNIVPWEFEAERYPDGLNMAAADPGAENPTNGTANPMNVIYEIMTDDIWGLGIPSSEIDVVNFQDAASALYAEGNGFAMLMDREKQASDMINEVVRQVDGTLWFDRGAGQWKMTLIRDGYDPGTLPEFDESNILELSEYTRQTWEETTNEVRLSYIDIDDNYKETYAFAQDMGNHLIQGGSVASEVRYPGVRDKALANSLAWRELRVLTYPLSKITVKMNRDGFALRPGSLFKYSNTRLGIDGVVYRVGRFAPGTLLSGEINVFAVEDIFSTGVGTFGDPVGSGWVEPNDAAVPVVSADTVVFEAGRQMVVQDPFAPTLEPRVWMGARNPGGGTVRFQSYLRTGPSHPTSGAFTEDAEVRAFLRGANLTADVEAYAAVSLRPTNVLTIDMEIADPDDISDLLVAGNNGDVASLVNIVKINDEILGFLNLTDFGTFYRMSVFYRGLFNTNQAAHSIGDTVWFLGQTGGSLTRISMADSHDEMGLQLRSVDLLEEVVEGLTPVEDVSLVRLWRQPLPVRDPVINSTYADTTNVSLDVQYTTPTGRLGEDASALLLECTVRDWRVDDVRTDHVLTAQYEDDAPELDYVLTLDPAGTPAVLAALVITDPWVDTQVWALRNDMIIAVGINTPMPTTASLSISPRHTPPEIGTEITGVALVHEFAITSELHDDDLHVGGLAANTASAAISFTETGAYAFDINTALPSSGILEADVDGGGYVTVIAAGNTTGTLTTSGGGPYSVVLRFTVAPTDDQYFRITGPTAEDGNGVLLA
ncbi:hypothetical protein DRQ50_00140 [bacterium]|nr:MAG: hypothetical protein DRQ50_00140 [bacterium]RKZ72435.1 MAG: hypothetical protein DRQ48_00050 [Gammaproteobacteria bacterium]